MTFTETVKQVAEDDGVELWKEPSVSTPAQRRHDAGSTGGKAEREPPDDLKMGDGHGEPRNG